MNCRLPVLREKTAKLTTSPGVYLMKDQKSEIIYIGKAKNLKNRVTSYFRESADHTPKVASMVEHVYDYDFIVTDSEYEALVLECSLIKQHQPKYNILLKDDKGYTYLCFSEKQINIIAILLGKYPDELRPMLRTTKPLPDYRRFQTVYFSCPRAANVFRRISKRHAPA